MTHRFQTSLGLGILLLLTACGGGGGSSADPEPGPKEAGVCGESAGAINQEALQTADCQYLSSYRLFADASDPTAGANGGGLAFELNTPLFTDYASKYRFVFVPEGTHADYQPLEAFEFPVGTVISKTFALPADTAFRGLANETLIETRLLIHRPNGWVALPYVWDAEGGDATLQVAGASVPSTLVHNGQQMSFDYQVPDKNQCKQCHQFSAGDTSRITPIGPKARNLNGPLDYGDGEVNQLTYWQQQGVLSGLPTDLGTVAAVPTYRDGDEQGLAQQSDQQLEALAKGYLDINCAHCHRPEGGASNTGLHLEYWRSLAAEPSKHGVCKRPVAYGGGSRSWDVVPGDAEQSILHARMVSTEPGDRMPEIGRALSHGEGVALVAAWINRMTGDCQS